MPVLSGMRMLSEGLRTLYEKLIDVRTKVDMKSQK